jgi:aminopeptidase N
LITTHLKNPNTFTQIAPSNRAQLIDDALNLARGGYLNYGTALDVTKYLSHETDYVPWKAAINAMNFIDSMLLRSGQYYKFKVSVKQTLCDGLRICYCFCFAELLFTLAGEHL